MSSSVGLCTQDYEYLSAAITTYVTLVNTQTDSICLAEVKVQPVKCAVLARGILSVRLSVRLSVTLRYCVQTNEDTIVRFSASGRTIPLVSGEVKFIRIFAGDHPQRGR